MTDENNKMNPLVKRYADEKRWVGYKLETSKSRVTKIPVMVNNQKASSTDSST